MEFTKSDLMLLYRNMVRSRQFELKHIEVFQAKKIRGFRPHSGIGQEALGAGGCSFLRPDDYLVKSHRGFAHDLSKGLPVARMFASIYARESGLCRGKGVAHFAYLERGQVGLSAILGACFPIAVGLGIAAQRAGRGQLAICYFGDGAAQRGTLHESMNWASVMKLPIIWLVENNGYFMNMPVSKSLAAKDMADFGRSYNMPSEIVDGQDVVAVCTSVLAAAERARSGAGPTLIECKTYRFRDHEEQEPGPSYGSEEERDPEEVKHWLDRDPIKLLRQRLIGSEVSAEELDAIDRAAEEEMRLAEEWAYAAPYPKPEEALEGLYAE